MSNLRKKQIYGSDVTKVLDVSDANTARTTSTVVGAVQIVDATGKVLKAGDAIGNAPIVKSTNYNASGTEIFTQASQGHVVAHRYCLEVAKGNITGVNFVNKFGNNTAVGTAFETIWSGGGIYAYPASAVTMAVVSTDADDDGDPVGNGARTIVIKGLDTNYALQEETIILNGLTPVNSVNTYIRIYRAYVVTAGSSGGNEGTITVTNGGITYAQIDPADNQTLMAVYTVPAGKTAYIYNWYGNTGKAADLEVELRIRTFGQVFQLKSHMHIYENGFIRPYCVPEIATEKADIEVRAKTSAGTQECSAGFDFMLIDN